MPVQPEPTFEPDDSPPPRRGCSCWLILLILITLAGLGLALAFLVGVHYSEKAAFDGMSAAEQAKFRKWMTEPIVIPEEMLVVRPALPPKIQKKKVELAKLTEQLDNTKKKFRWIDRSDTLSSESMVIFKREWPQPTAYCPLVDKLALGFPLTTTETLMVEQELPALMQHAQKASELVNHPDYILNGRNPITNDMYFFYLSCTAPELVGIVAYIHFANNDVVAAVDAYTTAVKLLERDPDRVLLTFTADHALQLAKDLSRTSNSMALRQLKQIMEIHREHLVDVHSILSFTDRTIAPALGLMQDTGYLKSLPGSRREVFECFRSVPLFANWLKKNTLPNGVSKADLDDVDIKFMYEPNGLGYMESKMIEKLSIGPLKPIMQSLVQRFSLPAYVYKYKDDIANEAHEKHLRQQYDELLQEIDERIQALEAG